MRITRDESRTKSQCEWRGLLVGVVVALSVSSWAAKTFLRFACIDGRHRMFHTVALQRTSSRAFVLAVTVNATKPAGLKCHLGLELTVVDASSWMAIKSSSQIAEVTTRPFAASRTNPLPLRASVLLSSVHSTNAAMFLCDCTITSWVNRVTLQVAFNYRPTHFGSF